MNDDAAAFIGIDLAWGLKAQTGIAVVDDAGRLVQCGVVRTDEIDEGLRTVAKAVVVIAIDAPLIVPNGLTVSMRQPPCRRIC